MATLGLALGGCSSAPEKDSTNAAVTNDEVLAAGVAKSAHQMQAALDKMTPEEREELRASALLRPRTPRIKPVDLPAVSPPVETTLAAGPGTEVAGASGKPPAGFVAPDPSEVRGNKLAAEFGNSARPQGISPSLLSAMQLAARATNDAAATKELAGIEKGLTASDRAVLVAFKSMLTAAGDPVAKSDADWAKLLADHAATLSTSGSAGISISRSLLCRRVEAFGRFTPLDLTTLVAGRPIAAIVYIELENFGYSPSSKAWLDGPIPDADSTMEWEVAISQEIEVLMSSGGPPLKKVEATVARDISRSKRRELYLVQRIDLPATLAAGHYVLKTHVKDLATGAEADSIVSFTLVADALTGASNGK